MVILKTQSQVSSFLKRNKKGDYDGSIYDAGSVVANSRSTYIDGKKIVQMTTVSQGWDDYYTTVEVLAIIKIKRN